MRIDFGNKKRNGKPLTVGLGEKTRFLVNIGHMDDTLSLEDEKRKVQIAYDNQFDIIADNSISSSSYDFRKWIAENYPLKINSVPIYQCFDKMQNGTFEYSYLREAISQHIDSGVDMIVVHPGLTSEIASRLKNSNRVIPLTSRGGAQIYSYMSRFKQENPYYSHWDEILDQINNTGVCLALGLTLRAGSIIDELDELYLKEMDICGTLIQRALAKNIPVVIEGIGHVRLKSINTLLNEVNYRCHNVPIKTLGPVGSDRLCGLDNINALISSSVAALSGVSIIGALLKSEHIGLPCLEDYERDLPNYRILKYLLELENDNQEDLRIEKNISIARRNRCWNEMFQSAMYPEIARSSYYRYNERESDVCTMCGNRCAHKLVLGSMEE